MYGLLSLPIIIFISRKLNFLSLIAQLVKNLCTVKETPVRFLGWEDPLEEGMATYPIILAWRKEPGRLQFTGLQRVGHGSD